MAETQECPLCGERMRLVPRTITDRVPGLPETVTRTIREWMCPDCDYFEEYEEPPAQRQP